MSGFTRRDCKWDGRSYELTAGHPLTGAAARSRPHRQLESKRAARADGKGRSATGGGCSAGLLHELLSLVGTERSRNGRGSLREGSAPRTSPVSGIPQPPRTSPAGGIRSPRLLRSLVGSGASLLGSREGSGGKPGWLPPPSSQAPPFRPPPPAARAAPRWEAALRAEDAAFSPGPTSLTLCLPQLRGEPGRTEAGVEGAGGASARSSQPCYPHPARPQPPLTSLPLPGPERCEPPTQGLRPRSPNGGTRPLRRRKLQAGKFRVRTAPGDVATSLCPALPRGVSAGGVSGGGGTHLPSAIALFILGVGEGTSGGAKSSGSGTILEKAEQVLVQKLQPERGAERGEGALPVPVPSLIGGMSSPRAGVSIQARLPLPPCPPACLLPPSSLPPAARTGPGPGLRRIPRRQSRRRRRGARSLQQRIPGASERGAGLGEAMNVLWDHVV